MGLIPIHARVYPSSVRDEANVSVAVRKRGVRSGCCALSNAGAAAWHACEGIGAASFMLGGVLPEAKKEGASARAKPCNPRYGADHAFQAADSVPAQCSVFPKKKRAAPAAANQDPCISVFAGNRID